MMVSASLVQTKGWQRSFQPSMNPDRLDQITDGVEGAAADGLAGDDPEEDLDQVQPRPRGGGEVQGDPRVARQPRVDRRMLVWRSCRTPHEVPPAGRPSRPA